MSSKRARTREPKNVITDRDMNDLRFVLKALKRGISVGDKTMTIDRSGIRIT